MKKYVPLTVDAKCLETRDSVRIALAVPDDLKASFDFLAGQHLPISIVHDGKTLRRTYSICSSPGVWPLEIGVRVQPGGRFSEYAANELDVGDELQVMPPFGQFHVGPASDKGRRYVAIAAGSGITPILSIVASILRSEPTSVVTLFYGNRKQSTTMFIDDLYALKNRYPARLQLQFVFSREDQEFPIAAGRLDADKLRELYTAFCRGSAPDEAYVCGPDTMIDTVTDTLVELGMPRENVHSERFGAPRRGAAEQPGTATDADGAHVTVILDGHKKDFDMAATDANIVDAAAEHGIELPYSCKGGVCATCRCHLRDGEVEMAINYGLEPWELEKGYILACQSRPKSPSLVLDYDKT